MHKISMSIVLKLVLLLLRTNSLEISFSCFYFVYQDFDNLTRLQIQPKNALHDTGTKDIQKVSIHSQYRDIE